MDAKITDNFDLSLDLSGYVSEQDEPGASAGVGSYASISSKHCYHILT